jgi:hypothetical protein
VNLLIADFITLRCRTICPDTSGVADKDTVFSPNLNEDRVILLEINVE